MAERRDAYLAFLSYISQFGWNFQALIADDGSRFQELMSRVLIVGSDGVLAGAEEVEAAIRELRTHWDVAAGQFMGPESLISEHKKVVDARSSLARAMREDLGPSTPDASAPPTRPSPGATAA